MKTKSHESGLRKLCALSAAAVACSLPAHAFEFNNAAGTLTGSFDTTVSVGAAWRAQGRDPSLVGIANGGTARSVNADDGNLNFDKGDLVSLLTKVTHDLELKRENYGLFLRGTYFYDNAYHNLEVNGATPNGGVNGFGQAGKDRLASDARLLDAYVRGDFHLGERTLNARLGRQVVNWGESTFIPNGINIINPVDVARLRAPGAELKEALLPSPMLWLSQKVTNNVTVEGLYLTDFDKTRLDPSGSFFSTTDALADGGDKLFAGFGRRKDQRFSLSSPANPDGQAWMPRADDHNPRDSGQYGLAMRWFLPNLNNTELGFFHANYHSRTPILSGTAGSSTNSLNLGAGGGTGRYFAEFPEDIRLYGLSFNTGGPAGIALQGEYSYRPNLPLQIATPEVALAIFKVPSQISATPLPDGTEVTGFRRVKMHQVQMTATKAFGPTLGAEQFTLVGEAGYNRFSNLPNDVFFQGPGVQLPAAGTGGTAASAGSAQPVDAYLTTSSWGYRLVGALTYSNAIGAGNLIPRLAFAHDVRGVGPNFNEGTKAVTLGLGWSYKEKWQADVSYTNFFGGRTYTGTDPGAVPAGQSQDFAFSSNPLKDRDFYSVSVSYSF